MSRLQNGIDIWSPIFVIIPSCKTAKTCFLIVYCPVNSIKLFGNDYRTDIILRIMESSIFHVSRINLKSSENYKVDYFECECVDWGIELTSTKYASSRYTICWAIYKYQWIISKISSKVAKCSLDRAIGALTNFTSRFWEDWVLQTFFCFDIDNWS